MKIFKKILILIIITAILTTTLIGSVQINVGISSNVASRNPVKVGVLLFDFRDPYMSLVRQSLEDIQKVNESKVEFTFFDGKGDQAIQNDVIDSVIQNDFELLLVNLVDVNTAAESVIDKVKQKNIPIILFNTAPDNIVPIQSYEKAIVVATDAEQSGVLQGKILVDAWNTDKKAIDKNGDNILQYIMLMGPRNNTQTIARTKYSILTINNAGIETQELASKFCNWNEEEAKNAIEPLFLTYGNKIEAIIANNDAMAIGAIEALQKYGYNNGDKTKTISVVGIDAIPAAQDLIKKGFMAGTVIQDPSETAEALYTVGMNLVSNKAPLDGTNYKFDDTGVVIKMPYHEYIPQ